MYLYMYLYEFPPCINKKINNSSDELHSCCYLHLPTNKNIFQCLSFRYTRLALAAITVPTNREKLKTVSCILRCSSWKRTKGKREKDFAFFLFIFSKKSIHTNIKLMNSYSSQEIAVALLLQCFKTRQQKR